jgi:RimJ/RimL family protein N-acetyltransferase
MLLRPAAARQPEMVVFPAMPERALLRTATLQLRAAAQDDLDALHRLWTHPEVRRYLFDDQAVSLQEARGFLGGSDRSFREEGYGLWLFFDKESEDPAGFAGFLRSPAGEPNLIFGTRPDRRGRGYATDAASAVIAYAFEVLGRQRIVAEVDEPNLASIRVLERLGMQRTGRAIVKGRPLLYYSLERPLEPPGSAASGAPR